MKTEGSLLREQFIEQGFSGPVRILSGEECREALLHTYKIGNPPVWPKASAVLNHYFYQLATRADILEFLRMILGEDILLWGARLVYSEPGAEHPWHSDIECCGKSGRTATVWIGLDKTNLNSALNVISFSHSFGESVQEAAFKQGKKRTELSTEDVVQWAQQRDPRTNLIRLDAHDGDALFLNGKLWHHSKNTSEDGTRTALLLQYCTPDAEIRAPHKKEFEWPFRFSEERPPCLLVSGSDRYERNRIVPPPASDTIHPCVIRHIDSLHFKKKKEGWRSGSIFKRSTETLETLTSHVSILEEGAIPHDPHIHEEEELLIVLSGEVDIIREDSAGQQRTSERLTPGSFVYHAAYQSHTLCSIGPGPAQYLMFKWKGKPHSEEQPILQSGTFDYWTGKVKKRQGWKRIVIFQSPTLYLGKLNGHLSVLEPGGGYASHRDSYDVAILVLSGKVETLDHLVLPQSVIYYPANELHGMKNPGDDPAVYLVFEFHGK